MQQLFRAQGKDRENQADQQCDGRGHEKRGISTGRNTFRVKSGSEN